MGLDAMAAGGAEERGGLEAAVRGRLHILRERWRRRNAANVSAAFAGPSPPSFLEEAEKVSALQTLPVSEARSGLGGKASCIFTAHLSGC